MTPNDANFSRSREAPRTTFRVLIVDPHRARRAELAEAIRGNYTKAAQFEFASDAAETIALLERENRECLFVAANLPDGSSIELVDRVAANYPQVAVVLISDQEDAEIQSTALRRGTAVRISSRYTSPGELEGAIRLARQRITEAVWNQTLMRDVRETDQEMDHFVRSLSHDMTANFMLLEHSIQQLKQVYDDPEPGEFDDSIRHVEACLQESKRFLDDLVRLGKTGTIEMEAARVELGDVVDEAIFEQRGAIREAGFDVRIERPLPAVSCNAKRAKQVVTNLIRNALRHGRATVAPTLWIRPAEGEAKPGFAAIEVADNGPGIPVELSERIFLPGMRGPTPDESGSGMGLAIVKKIAEHYGGSVSIARTSPSGGATFVFSLPVAAQVPPRRPKLPRGNKSRRHGPTPGTGLSRRPEP